MITLQQACNSVLKEFPNAKITGITDVGAYWLLGICDKRTNAEPDGFAPAVNKSDGAIWGWSFPAHHKDLARAKEVPIPDLTL